jgi:YD repeat-containing protein
LQSQRQLNGTGADVNTSYTYANPIMVGGKYYGMADVTLLHPDLTTTTYSYESASGPKFGLPTHVLNYFSGVSPVTQQTVYYPIIEHTYSYATGGFNNQLVAPARTLTREYGTNGGQKTRAATYTNDFSTLPLQVLSVTEHGLVDSSSTITTLSEATLLSDNIEYTMTYYPAATSAPFVRNLLHTIEGKVSDGTLITKLKYEYDTNFNLSKSEALIEGTTYRTVRTTYNALGQLTDVTGPMGEKIKIEYNGMFPKSYIRDPQGLNFKKSFIFNQDSGQMSSSTDENGRKLTYTYDHAFRRTSESAISAIGTRTWQYAYNFGGLVGTNYVSVTTPDTSSLVYLDGFGRPIQNRLDLENGGGHLISDALFTANTGKTSHISTPYLGTGAPFSSPAGTQGLQFGYTLADTTSVAPLQSGNGIGAWSMKHESADGMDPFFTTIQNPRGHTNSSTNGLVQQDIFQGDGTEKIVTRVEKDLKNLLTRISYQASHTFEIKFNSQNQPTALDQPFETPETITYDASGRVYERIAKEGNKIQYSYDGIGRVTQMKGYDSSGLLIETLIYTYDTTTKASYLVLKGESAPATIQSSVDKVYFSYTHDGHHLSAMTQEKNGVAGSAKEFLYEHYPDGKLEKVIHPNGVIITYTYDALGRPKKISSPAVNNIFPNGLISEIVSRDERGLITAQNLGDGTAITVQYAPNSGAMLHYLAMKGSVKVYEATFTYDNLMLIRIDESTATDARTIEMTEFNSLDQLRRFKINGTPYEVGYDTFGRPVQNTFLGQDWTYNDLSSNPYQPVEESGSDVMWNQNRQLLSKEVPSSTTAMTLSYSPFGDVTQVHNENGALHYLWSALGNIFESDEFYNGVNYKTTVYGSNLFSLYRAIDLVTNEEASWSKITVLGDKPTLPFRKNDDIVAEFIYGDSSSFEGGSVGGGSQGGGSGGGGSGGGGGSQSGGTGDPGGGGPSTPPGDPVTPPTPTPRPGSCEACHGGYGPGTTPYPFPFPTPDPGPGEDPEPTNVRFPLGGCKPSDIASASCALEDPAQPVDDTINQPQDKSKTDYAYKGNCNEGVETTTWGTTINHDTGEITIKAGSCMSCHEVYSSFGPRLRDQFSNYKVAVPGVMNPDQVAVALHTAQTEGIILGVSSVLLAPLVVATLSAGGAVITSLGTSGLAVTFVTQFSNLVFLTEVAVGTAVSCACPYDAPALAVRPTLFSGITSKGPSPTTRPRTPCKFVKTTSAPDPYLPDVRSDTWTPVSESPITKITRLRYTDSGQQLLDTEITLLKPDGTPCRILMVGELKVNMNKGVAELQVDGITIMPQGMDEHEGALKNVFGTGALKQCMNDFRDWGHSLGYPQVRFTGYRSLDSTSGNVGHSVDVVSKLKGPGN